MDLRKVRVYVISPGVGKYEARLINTISRLRHAGFRHIEHVPSVPDGNPTDSLSRSNLVIFDREKDQTGPFLVIEDDIQIEDNITEDMWVLPVPHDAAAVYLGVSMWVYPHGYHTLSCGRHIRVIAPKDTVSWDDRLVSIQGMTSAHAILFLDRSFLRTVSLCIQSYLPVSTPHDLILATLQQYYKVYALKQPFFYQDNQQGGQQKETRLIWLNDRYYSRKG